jgi:hypothetical protein
MGERTTETGPVALLLKLFPGEGVRLTLDAETEGKKLSVNLRAADVRRLRDDLSLLLVKLPQ